MTAVAAVATTVAAAMAATVTAALVGAAVSQRATRLVWLKDGMKHGLLQRVETSLKAGALALDGNDRRVQRGGDGHAVRRREKRKHNVPPPLVAVTLATK